MIKFFKRDKEESEENRSGFFGRMRKGLSKTRSGFTGRLDQLMFGKKEIDEDILEDLEEILFTSDLGVVTTQELVDVLADGVARKELDNPDMPFQGVLHGGQGERKRFEAPHQDEVLGASSPQVQIGIGIDKGGHLDCVDV